MGSWLFLDREVHNTYCQEFCTNFHNCRYYKNDNFDGCSEFNIAFKAYKLARKKYEITKDDISEIVSSYKNHESSRPEGVRDYYRQSFLDDTYDDFKS